LIQEATHSVPYINGMAASISSDTPWSEWSNHGVPNAVLTAIRSWLPDQRWFLSKGADLSPLRASHVLSMPVGPITVWWLILELPTKSGVIHRYQLPLALVEDPRGVSSRDVIAQLKSAGWLIDAWIWPPFAETLLRRLQSVPLIAGGAITWWVKGIVEPVPCSAIEIPHHEQTNSSVRYGDRYYLKAFRFLTHGLHPEEEMGWRLTRHEATTSLPLVAAFHWEQSCLAVLYDFVPNEGAAWSWLLRQLHKGSGLKLDLAAEMERLGQRTASLHRILAGREDDPAFSVEPYTLDDYHGFQARLLEQWVQVLEHLSRHVPREAIEREAIDDLAAHDLQFKAWVQSQSFTTNLGSRIRVHGDFHLGQVLRRQDGDWVIIDFEGEPLRPLAERRAKDSPLRDVAGMRRSFDYLADAVKLDPTAATKAATLKTAFTYGYFNNMTSSGLLPDDATTCEQLLRLYELEKTLYEVEYELRSRPEWLGIPLRALHEFIRGVVKP
jgi:trehalose synthase-fused probable maltokinase